MITITPSHHREFLPPTFQNLFYPPLKEDYTYFRRAGEFPFVSSSSVAKAAWAADASMLAYARYGETRMDEVQLKENFDRAGLKHYKLVGGSIKDIKNGNVNEWNEPGTQAVFAFCEDFAIFAFRGTERDDPTDLQTDAHFFPVHEPDYRPAPDDPEPALGYLSFVTHLFSLPALVHRGFQSALNQVWEPVHQLVTDYRKGHPDKEICFTGHSLGGALAVLAFSRFSDHDISLYTFGCPRVGDAAFRDRVLSNPGRGIFRYVNYNDVVTHVPTESLLYVQTPSSCYRFTEHGDLRSDDGTFKGDVESLRAAIDGMPKTIRSMDLKDPKTIEVFPSLVDHSPARYCFRLWDCV